MKKSYMTAGLLAIGLALATAAAGQNPTTNSPQGAPPTAAPSQSAPSQAAPTQSPAAPGQVSPGTPAGSAQTQSQAQTANENPLNLTEEQKAKLRPILIEENQQMDKVRNDTTMTQEQKMAKANEIRQTASPKIKAILTPEQLQKLADLQKARQQQNQSAPTTPAAPPHN